jgi:hypothetical protein
MKSISKAVIYQRTSSRHFATHIAPTNAQDEKAQKIIDKWVKRIQAKSTTSEGKGYSVQLTSLINYYTRRPESDQVEEINWEQWKNELNTKDIVDKIKGNHESLMKESYDKAPILERVEKTRSPYEDSINKEMMYHSMLWMTFYMDNIRLKVNLEYVPRLTECALHEKADLMPGVEAENQRRVETHAYLPGALDDVNFQSYLVGQFMWGKKVSTYYRHPSDDFRALKATKNIMGR